MPTRRSRSPIGAPGRSPGDFASSQVYVWDRLNPGPQHRGQAGIARPRQHRQRRCVVAGDLRRRHVCRLRSTAVNLVIGASLPPCIDSCPPQIYRYNRIDGTIVLVSRVPASLSTQIIGSDLGATQPAISSDGSQVAFVTRSTNLLTTRAGRRRSSDRWRRLDLRRRSGRDLPSLGAARRRHAGARRQRPPQAVGHRTRRGVRHPGRRGLQPARSAGAQLDPPGRRYHPATATVDRRHRRRHRHRRSARLGVVRAAVQRRARFVRAQQGPVDQPRLRHHLR